MLGLQGPRPHRNFQIVPIKIIYFSLVNKKLYTSFNRIAVPCPHRSRGQTVSCQLLNNFGGRLWGSHVARLSPLRFFWVVVPSLRRSPRTPPRRHKPRRLLLQWPRRLHL